MGATTSSATGSPTSDQLHQQESRGKLVIVGITGAIIGALGSVAAVFFTPIADDWWQELKAFSYEIVEPDLGAEVSAKKGFTAKGTVRNLPRGESLWVLDRDNDGFYVAQSATFQGETWSARSAPLGEDDQRRPFESEFVLVRATPNCADSIRNAQDQFLKRMPKECVILETRFVRVTRP